VIQELLKEEKTLAQIASEYARASDTIKELEGNCLGRNAKPF